MMNADVFHRAFQQTVQDWRHGRLSAQEGMQAMASMMEEWRPLEHLAVVFPAPEKVSGTTR